jgi:anti-anti-sigma factor
MRPPEVDMDPLLSHVKIINDGLTAHVFLAGEFDAAEADALARDLRPLIDAPPHVVALNLREVTYMCSRGLTPIIELRGSAERAHSEWAIIDASTIAARLIDLVGLSEVLGLSAMSRSA